MLTWESSDFIAFDPQTAFRIGPMSRFLGEKLAGNGWWSAVLELRKSSIDDLAAMAYEKKLGLLISPDYDEEERKEVKEVQYVAVHARSDFLEVVNLPDDDGQPTNPFKVSRIELGSITDNEAMLHDDSPAVPGRSIAVPEDTIIMAVIDSGVCFAHELFRMSDNTSRVEFAWIMDAQPTNAPPKGRKFVKADINGMIARNTHGQFVDEDAIYREAGLADFAFPGLKPGTLRVSHGTHVMGLAAGQWPDRNEHTRPIICVQLPTKLVEDVTGQHLLADLGLALAYVMNRASRFHIVGQPQVKPPVVVNFSFGNFSGPHDGTSVIARMLDFVFRSKRPLPKQKRRLLLPSGNGNLSRCHASISFDETTTEATLDWRLQPDDRSASFVQMWMPWRAANNDKDLVEVTVTTPAGATSSAVGIAFGQTEDLVDENTTTIATLSFRKWAFPTQRGLIELCVSPTVSLDGRAAVSPAGLWKIRIKQKNITSNESVEVWIKRDETLPGFPQFGRQSYFDNACYQRFDAFGAPLAEDPPGDPCIIRRAGLLSGFACGWEPSVIAGYIESNGEIARYSAGGPITEIRDTGVVTRCGPDAAARSDDSPVLSGVLSAGSRSGGLVAMNGTSVATPQAAYWVAGDIANGGEGDRAAVRADGAAGNSGFESPDPMCERGGGGRMATPRFLNAAKRT